MQPDTSDMKATENENIETTISDIAFTERNQNSDFSESV